MHNLAAAGNVFLWDRLSLALGSNAPTSFLQDFLVPAAPKPAAPRPAMPAVPVRPTRKGQAGGRGRGRGRTTRHQGPPAQVSAQGQQQRAAEVGQQIAAAAETVLGTSISPSQALMDAGLDSLGQTIPRPLQAATLWNPHHCPCKWTAVQKNHLVTGRLVVRDTSQCLK